MTEQPVPTIAGVLGCTRIILGESTIVFKLPANVFIWIPAIIDTNSFDLDVNIVSFGRFSRRLRSIGVKMWGLRGYKVRLLEIVLYIMYTIQFLISLWDFKYKHMSIHQWWKKYYWQQSWKACHFNLCTVPLEERLGKTFFNVFANLAYKSWKYNHMTNHTTK